jgi:hypothetical protein
MQANWGIPNIAYTYSTATTAPDGSVIYSINKNTSYQLIRMSLFNAATISYPATYTLSFWAKTLSGTGSLMWDIGDGVGSAAGAASLTTTWQRFTYTMTAASAATFPSGGFIDFTIPDNNTYAIWGAQFETGGTATSYIPTYGATATRAADVSVSAATTRARDSAALIGSNFTSWWKNTEQSYYAEAAQFPATEYGRLIDISDGATQRYSMYRQSGTGTNGINSQIQVGGDSWSTNTFAKFAASFSSTGISSGFNGTLRTNVATFTPFTADRMNIGQQSDSNGVWNGHIKKIVYYPYRLSNTQLQALTV